MNLDFHYYGTYCAARLAGYGRTEAEEIAYYAQFVDECSESLLKAKGVPADKLSVTVNTDDELTAQFTDLRAYTTEPLRQVSGIWSAFHFLPGNLGGEIEAEELSEEEQREFRRLCLPDSSLMVKMVQEAKADRSLPAIGMAMHVLADTWAHSYFAGIPAKHVNDIQGDVHELREDREVRLTLTLDTFDDNLEGNRYSHTPPNVFRDKSIVYLGHGRIGHLPDYSFMRYAYKPAWLRSGMTLKNNAQEYRKAFCQMIAAMQYIRGDREIFDKHIYAELDAVKTQRLQELFKVRVLRSDEQWRHFIENDLSREDTEAGCIEGFDVDKCFREYVGAEHKNETGLAKFLTAAKNHRYLVEKEAGPYPA
ncbi:MAG: hypothetical protein K2N81_01075 [Acetatifactor sp.]|nr:hypothetical protein [Acetatifactor sp.]